MEIAMKALFPWPGSRMMPGRNHGQSTQVRIQALNAFCAVLCLVAASTQLRAQMITVKYGGEIDLAPFQCTDISQRGRIGHVCYDDANRYLLIKLDQSYHQYCEVEAGTVQRFLASHSINHFFKTKIENRHSCRPENLPKYEQAQSPSTILAPSASLAEAVPSEGVDD
jgi:hypothetical protein